MVRVARLCPLGASSRMVVGAQPSPNGVGSSRFVSPPLGASCSFWRGQGYWCWKALYAASISLGPSILRPALVAHVRRYAWKMTRAGCCGSEGNGAWWAPHSAMTFICVGLMYTMVMVAPTGRGVAILPAGCRWMSVYLATSGTC